mgnify:CR=1 FL=1
MNLPCPLGFADQFGEKRDEIGAAMTLCRLAFHLTCLHVQRGVERRPLGVQAVEGGLIVMSLIPSKRLDRIFPVIPPLCLLLAAQISGRYAALRRPQGSGDIGASYSRL